MDAEHRHELKQNDFVEYVKRTPELIKKHWIDVIIVVLAVIIVSVMISRWVSSRQSIRPDVEKQAKVTSIYQDIAQAKGEAISGEGNIDKTEEMVSDLLDKSAKLRDAQQAMAKIKAADAIRAQLHYSDQMPAQDVVESHVSEAISLYEQAAKLAPDNVDIQAMAQYGIALSNEDGGNFDQAATVYGQIVANTDFDKTCFVKLAKDKLATLAMVKQKFAFIEPAPAPVVETPEAATEENAVN